MTQLRVLHVEDESDIREVVEISLGLDPDIILRSCGSGEEALALVRDWPPDIILLDVMMPVMDGPATLAHLRANERTAKIPVVFMTARAQSRELDLFRSLGAAGVIPKPFDPMTLVSSVRGYVHTLHDEICALRHRFIQRLINDAATLAEYRNRLGNTATLGTTLILIKETAHSLAGAGGIYGFPEIGDAASKLEDATMTALETPTSIDGVLGALDQLLIFLNAEKGVTNLQSLVINATG